MLLGRKTTNKQTNLLLFLLGRPNLTTSHADDDSKHAPMSTYLPAMTQSMAAQVDHAVGLQESAEPSREGSAKSMEGQVSESEVTPGADPNQLPRTSVSASPERFPRSKHSAGSKVNPGYNSSTLVPRPNLPGGANPYGKR